MTPRCIRPYLMATVACLLALGSRASAGTISDVIFHLDASNDLGTGGLEFPFSEMAYNATTLTWDWTKGSTPINNGAGQEMARLTSAKLVIMRNPDKNVPYRINLDFAVAAGASLTRFTITSALLSFAEIPLTDLVAPDHGGRTTTSFGLQDKNGDGAQFIAVGPVGAGVYTAQYDGAAPGGTTFANLLHQLLASAGGQASGGQNKPTGAGYESIASAVHDMSVQLDFTLTAGDTVSGATSYRVLPEPGAGLGLLLGALAIARRR